MILHYNVDRKKYIEHDQMYNYLRNYNIEEMNVDIKSCIHNIT